MSRVRLILLALAAAAAGATGAAVFEVTAGTTQAELQTALDDSHAARGGVSVTFSVPEFVLAAPLRVPPLDASLASAVGQTTLRWNDSLASQAGPMLLVEAPAADLDVSQLVAETQANDTDADPFPGLSGPPPLEVEARLRLSGLRLDGGSTTGPWPLVGLGHATRLYSYAIPAVISGHREQVVHFALFEAWNCHFMLAEAAHGVTAVDFRPFRARSPAPAESERACGAEAELPSGLGHRAVSFHNSDFAVRATGQVGLVLGARMREPFVSGCRFRLTSDGTGALWVTGDVEGLSASGLDVSAVSGTGDAVRILAGRANSVSESRFTLSDSAGSVGVRVGPLSGAEMGDCATPYETILSGLRFNGGSRGVLVVAARDTRLQGCVFDSPVQSAVELVGPAGGTTIRGCSAGTRTSGVDVVRVGAGTRGTSIVDNELWHLGTVPGTIVAIEAGAEGVSVSANLLTGGGTGVRLRSPASLVSNTVRAHSCGVALEPELASRDDAPLLLHSNRFSPEAEGTGAAYCVNTDSSDLAAIGDVLTGTFDNPVWYGQGVADRRNKYYDVRHQVGVGGIYANV